MKMKKTKLLIPAIGMLVFTSAASVSGTVAWFTANRVFQMTAGEFAVINTKNNLSCTLGGGVGTTASSNAVTTKANYLLTDASFDHVNTAHNFIIPNDDGTKIHRVIALASADEGSANTDNHLFRQNGTNSTKIFSAFTWTLTFSVTFAEAETQDLGLFLDLSATAKSYVHEKVTGAIGDDGTGLYTDVDLSTAATVDGEGKLTAAGTYYKAAPDDTGKAFRIALIPTAATPDSYGVAKVWAENQTSAKCLYVTTAAAGTTLTTGSGTAYGTDTTKVTHPESADVIAAETAGSNMVLMASGDNSGVPADNAKTAATALSSCSNYLGYFKANAGGQSSLTFTAVAWYEGTDENIETANDTKYETVVAGLEFGTARLSNS